ncbi:MAG: glycosyltransferase family 2 protein [Candidatus Tritonobacter lacicola]|nr:glycosyltransferase family 2 protein [Candidatus Tritonobacter lacicola]
MKKHNISLFYPMHNEEGNIKEAVRAALEVLPAVAENYEVIVVDDGSKDGTGKIADELASKDEHVRAVHHPVNRGYGGALKTGFKEARYELVFFADGDNQFDLGEMSKLLERIDDCDMVIGRRVDRKDPFHRKLNAHAWNMLVRILFGLKVKDIDCAFKLIRRRVLEGIELEATGALISTELLVKAHKAGFKMEQVPVHHRERLSGEQSGADIRVIARAFKELFKMYCSLKRGTGT